MKNMLEIIMEDQLKMTSDEQAIREIYKREKIIEILHNDIDNILLDNDLEDVDLSDEFLRIAKKDSLDYMKVSSKLIASLFI